MKNKEEFVKAVTDAIKEMSSKELFELNNRFCDSANYPDNRIYENETEFFDLFPSVESFARSVGDKYEYNHRFVTFDGCGNLESFNRITVNEIVDFPATMAEYIAENWDEFCDLFDFEEEEETV